MSTWVDEISNTKSTKDVIKFGQMLINELEGNIYGWWQERLFICGVSYFFHCYYKCYVLHYMRNYDGYCSSDIRESVLLNEFKKLDKYVISSLIAADILERSDACNLFIKIIDILFEVYGKDFHLDGFNNLPVNDYGCDHGSIFKNVLSLIHRSDKYTTNKSLHCDLTNDANEYINIIQRSI